MSEPLPKSPQLTRFLEKIFGATSAIQHDVCCICQLPATDFRDEVTQREYQQSGVCQHCQDIVFQPGEPQPPTPDPEPLHVDPPRRRIRRI